MQEIDLDSLREAAKAGATWKDLAAIIGISDRTLRRWREELEEADQYVEGYFDGLEGDELRPVPDEAAQILAAINAGRAEGRQELVSEIRRLSIEKQDMRGLIALLKRMDVAWTNDPRQPQNPPKNRLRADKADIFYEFIHKNTPIHPSRSPNSKTRLRLDPAGRPAACPTPPQSQLNLRPRPNHT